MAETLLSPGVLARENDQSQVTAGPIQAGAAILGPTVKGPVGIPTMVTSYSQYVNTFGTTFVSGSSDVKSFLTSISAYNYFNNGGNSLLVTRITSGSFSQATSTTITGSDADVTSLTLKTFGEGTIMNSDSTEDSSGALESGSSDNLRWEIVSSNATQGIAGSDLYYENITGEDNIQGVRAADYTQSIDLLSNQDEYQFNSITAPGLIIGQATSTITKLINMVQSRGDALAVVDCGVYGATLATMTSNASSYNSSYAATYAPWLQTTDPDSGQIVWVPASTMVPGVYAYNDSVSEAWFAPAGLNRGGLATVVRPERKLSQANRDTLYTGKVNPIASFPGAGTVVFGQKTLQTKASALDRINVRRLLIELKSYISQVSDNLVFEQNTIATRNAFLSQVNPYLESVQQRQGLYAFRVIMDDSNNTADVIDRNQLIGQIYIQPTKTAEFIYLDFNILPTGATFPA
jgi:phage tail sheath protein FI